MKYIKLFETIASYNTATLDLPNVSLIEENMDVYYNPYVPPFFCKLILNNGETVELEGSGELTSTMISPYISTCVSAEIGTLCTSIGNGAFVNCSGLTSVDIPNSVTSIGHGAFNGCSSLTRCAIGDGVTSIGSGVFTNCRDLTSINIPSGVTNIGGGAFQNCSSLTSIVSNAITAPMINYDTFKNIKIGGTLTVPQGSSGYDVWMGTDNYYNYYLGLYNWTKIEQ